MFYHIICCFTRLHFLTNMHLWKRSITWNSKFMVQCQVQAKNKSQLPTKAPCAKQASIQSPVTTCLHTLMAMKNFMVLDKDGATRWVHSRGFSVEIPPSWLTTYHKTVTLNKCVQFSLMMSISHMLPHIFTLIFSDISEKFRNLFMSIFFSCEYYVTVWNFLTCPLGNPVKIMTGWVVFCITLGSSMLSLNIKH